jgi:hypothetical protein
MIWLSLEGRHCCSAKACHRFGWEVPCGLLLGKMLKHRGAAAYGAGQGIRRGKGLKAVGGLGSQLAWRGSG